MDYFHADRRPVWRRSPGPDAFLRRQYRSMAFAPDLPGKPARHRDLPLGPRIETLSHGVPPAGPALDAGRCQRKARLAYPCGVGPAAHHPGEDAVRRRRTGVGPTNTVYALDSTTIALCLSVFPWAHFRTTKAAVKMHTFDLRGNIPSFIHISDGKLHDVHALDMLLPEAGAIYVVDRGYVGFARLYVLHQAGAFFVTRAKSNIDAHRVYSAPTDRSTGIICDQTISLDGFYTRQDYPELLRRSASRTPSPARRWSSSPTTSRFRPPPSARSTKAAGRWSSSSGSSSIFGSSSSTARRRTR